VTLNFDSVTLTFDLKHLQRIACDVMKFCIKVERNRAIRGGVIAISVFDLMTLNIALRVESSWYIKDHVIKVPTKFERNRAIPG